MGYDQAFIQTNKQPNRDYYIIYIDIKERDIPFILEDLSSIETYGNYFLHF